MTTFVRCVPIPMLLWLAACGGSDPGSRDLSSENPPASAALSLSAPAADDIDARLAAVPGVLEVTEAPTTLPGTRFFVLRFEQPLDHAARRSPKFSQRLTLIYRSREAPMVLATTGYDIPADRPYQSEPTALLKANQILLEHRFFGESVPTPLDWKKLDIFQAATDEHRIVEAFQPLFAKKWLTTGASKGGMTAIFHRLFYPNDVYASVP